MKQALATLSFQTAKLEKGLWVCVEGEGGGGGKREDGSTVKVNSMCQMDVMTQPVWCPQLCTHCSSGRQMEDRWARKVGAEAALGRRSRS